MADELTDAQKLRLAYSRAGTRLREEHQDEFNKFQTEEAAKLGLNWSPRPTGLDKARAEMEALFAAHPDLLREFEERLSNM